MIQEILENSRESRQDIKNLLITTGKQEEHLKNLNGTVKKHDNQIRENSKNIWIGIGGIGLFSVLAIIVTLIKTLQW